MSSFLNSCFCMRRVVQVQIYLHARVYLVYLYMCIYLRRVLSRASQRRPASPRKPLCARPVSPPAAHLRRGIRGSWQALKVNPGWEAGSSRVYCSCFRGLHRAAVSPGVPSAREIDGSAAGQRLGCRLSPAAPMRLPARSCTFTTGSHCPQSGRICPGTPLILKRRQFASSFLFSEGKL